MVFLGDRDVRAGAPPLIVAELSGNHGGSLGRALELVDAAADSGADAVKLQTYTADTMTLDLPGTDFVVQDPNSLWSGERLFDLYKRASTPWEWHEAIFERAVSRGLLAFSSVFDGSSVDFLEDLGVPFYKISSFECTDLPLIRRAAETGKPLVISTGMASIQEIDDAVSAARQPVGLDPIILKCTSSYPASPQSANLQTIPDMAARWGCPVGLSDHTLGIGVAVASVALGAVLVEKHLTLSRDDGAVDSEFSMTPEDFRWLVQATREAWEARGTVHYGPTESDARSLVYRRSLYFVRDMAAGEIVRPESIRSVRPGYGLPPAQSDRVVGRRVIQPVRAGDRVNWDVLDSRGS